jgi:hypothetical protein
MFPTADVMDDPRVVARSLGRNQAGRTVGAVLLVLFVVLLGRCGGGSTGPRGAVDAGGLGVCAAQGRPERCLRFVERAANVRSLRLTATIPTEVSASCTAAGRGTALRVVCPPVVPAGGVVSDPDLCGPQVVDRKSYSLSINNGQNPGRIHWEIGATSGSAARLWIFDRANWDATPPKHPAIRIGARRYLGHLITLWRFPDTDGQLEGHDAAFASEGGVSYFVSVHGHNHDDADIAMLLAILARAS